LVHSEKMASLGVLVSGIAHEINNPLNFVSGSIKLLQQHLRSVMDLVQTYDKLSLSPDDRASVDLMREELEFDFVHEDIQKNIKNIFTGAERMNQIVRNLRSFSRLDSGRREEFNIQEGLESTLQILYNQYKDRITIERDYQPGSQVVGNPGQLNQVFMNILHNAIQSIEKNGKISIAVHPVKGSMRISISDTGPGIDEKDLDHVFDPFFTTKKVGEGTGLGLSISYGIVKDHGGRLWVESERGKGSTFHIELPIQPAKEIARGM